MNADYAARQFLIILEQFGPKQRAAVRGLSAQQIETLETEIDRKFCIGHRVFLEHFGATSKGALNPILYNYDFSEAAIRAHYRRRSDTRPPNWVFWANIGADPQPYHAYALTISTEDPAIGIPEDSGILYESMWNTISLNAYVFLIADRFEHREQGAWLWEGRPIPLAEAAGPLAVLRQLLERLGFEPWIELFNAQCMMRRGDVVVWFGRIGTMPDPDDWNIELSGPDPRELREIREVLADNVGLVDYPIHS